MMTNAQEFALEPHDDDIIWRYLDLPKFLHFLKTSKLIFTKAKHFADGWEGAYSALSVSNLSKNCPDLAGIPLHKIQEMRQVQMDLIHISCWTLKPMESVALWKLYAAGGGVAIRSTWGKLKGALAPHGVEAKRVAYIDYGTFEFKACNMHDSFGFKRIPFEFESEVRFLKLFGIPTIMPEIPGHTTPVLVPSTTPYEVLVSIDEIVDAFVISPESPVWVTQVVSQLIEESGYISKVEQSTLLEVPPGAIS